MALNGSDYVITDLDCPRANSIESTSGTDTANDDDEIPFIPAFDFIKSEDSGKVVLTNTFRKVIVKVHSTTYRLRVIAL